MKKKTIDTFKSSNYKWVYSTLIVESTRQCNLQCRHCCRGPIQDAHISKSVIDAILLNFQEDSICDLTITGGEPLIHPQSLSLFAQLFSSGYVLSAFLVTNGYDTDREALELVFDFFSKTKNPSLCSLDVSRDQFHRSRSGRDMLPFLKKSVDKYNTITKHGIMLRERGVLDKTEILTEGNAASNNLGSGAPDAPNLIVYSYKETQTIEVSGELYINVFGDVILGCDYSYDHQNEVKLGNICQNDLKSILLDSNRCVLHEV